MKQLNGAFLIELGDSAALHYAGEDVYATVEAEALKLVKNGRDDSPTPVARSIHDWMHRIWHYRGGFYSLPIAVEEEYGDDALATCQALVEGFAAATPSIRDLVEGELAGTSLEACSNRRRAIPDDVKMFVWRRDE